MYFLMKISGRFLKDNHFSDRLQQENCLSIRRTLLISSDTHKRKMQMVKEAT